ncbi:ArsR/SmtB family transcription factor [Arthrobacter castelli]|uniref:ArsR/SmtB family transcription factor n=1 Tax=Arthrobacter castelli TaxID=271431 RepID=UPI00041D76BB|nr:metalloregulator ArsR/SmtB family transcription factor [Arthrobacter castelli]
MVIDDVFAVIAESTRRSILISLRPGDKAVGELVEELGVSQPTVSKHLKVLREAGLVRMRADGQRRYYGLETEPLTAVASWLAWFDVTPNGNGKAALHEGRDAVAAAQQGPPPAGTAETGTDTPAAAPDVVPDGVAGQPLQRSVGRAAGRAVDLFYNFPKLRRRR